jgi:hypothetical protein
MTFGEHPELREKSWNAAHTSTIMHMVETNGWNPLEQGWSWFRGREGLRLKMHARRDIPAGAGSRANMARDRISMQDGRCVIGDGPQEMDPGRWITIHLLAFCEDIAVMGCYTLLKIPYIDVKLRNYNPACICRHRMYRQHSSTE